MQRAVGGRKSSAPVAAEVAFGLLRWPSKDDPDHPRGSPLGPAAISAATLIHMAPSQRIGTLAAGLLIGCSSSGQAQTAAMGVQDASLEASSADDASMDAAYSDAASESASPIGLDASDDAGCGGDACTCGPGCCPGTVGGDYGTPCTYGCNCTASAVVGARACITGVCGATYGEPCGMQVGFSYPIPCAQGTCMSGFNGVSCQ